MAVFSSSMAHKYPQTLLRVLYLRVKAMYMEQCVMTTGMNWRPE